MHLTMRASRPRSPLWILWGLLAVAGCADDPATPADAPAIDDGASLVEALAAAYVAQDPDRFESLLANEASENAVFTFAVTDSSGAIHDSWSFGVESSMHHRMFNPEAIPPNDTPLPQELWLQSVDVTLTQRSDFVERDELYRNASNPDGFDPARWRIVAADYSTEVFFQMQSTEFVVNDREAEFVVIEDLTRDANDAAKFQLLSWSEACETVTIESVDECWSTVKSLYAK